MSWRREIIMISGASLVGSAIFSWLTLPSIEALAYQRPPVQSGTGLIAFVSDEPAPNIVAWTRVQGADPSADVPVNVYFSLASSVLPESLEAVSYTSSGISNGGGPEDLVGPSILLSGELGESLIDCGASAVWIQHEVSYESLNVTEKRAAVEYFLGSTRTVDGSDSDSGEPSANEEQRAADVASRQYYTTIKSENYSLYTDDYATGEDTSVDFESNLRQFTCTFDKEAFWNSDGDYVTFKQPVLLAASRGSDGIQGNAEVKRFVSILEPPFVRLSASSATSERDWAGLLKFDDESYSNDAERPVSSLEGFEAQFLDEIAAKERKNTIYVGGIGVGLLAGLSIQIVRSFALLVTRNTPLKKLVKPASNA